MGRGWKLRVKGRWKKFREELGMMKEKTAAENRQSEELMSHCCALNAVCALNDQLSNIQKEASTEAVSSLVMHDRVEMVGLFRKLYTLSVVLYSSIYAFADEKRVPRLSGWVNFYEGRKYDAGVVIRNIKDSEVESFPRTWVFHTNGVWTQFEACKEEGNSNPIVPEGCIVVEDIEPTASNTVRASVEDGKPITAVLVVKTTDEDSATKSSEAAFPVASPPEEQHERAGNIISPYYFLKKAVIKAHVAFTVSHTMACFNGFSNGTIFNGLARKRGTRWALWLRLPQQRSTELKYSHVAVGSAPPA
ncbi:LOW QUALITY PROTEIN: hypothetical protein Cgig2_002925 [Carnegiea gigantea]|uniref:Uncharacterized protein n=1 Tax=Carnegiea gigantea TaxID=171969 RepID=A0A9Q1JP53_9CARY|nr:LOW QUALITY PROTEIN: hypothetical protein Cgig2_002925 [Carnegiea gigantea]